MSDATYKVVDIIGSSPNSWEEATKVAVEKAGSHIADLRIAEVVAQDVKIENGKVTAFRTKLSLSFRFHDAAELSKQ